MAGVGLKIKVDDFNNLQEDVEKILGSSFTTDPQFGYGQPVRSSQVTVSDKVSVSDFSALRADIVNIALHQTGTLPSDAVGEDNLITPIEDEIIRFDTTDEPFDQYVNLTTTLLSNTFDINENYRQTVNILVDSDDPDTETPILRNWDPALGEQWGVEDTGIEVTVTVDFSSAGAARHFFNSGGKIQFSSRRYGGTVSGGTQTIRAQNENWSNFLLLNVGTREFGGNTPGTGVSPSNGLNFYRLRSTYQDPFVDLSSSSVYSNNYFQIWARTPDVADNDDGEAKTIEFTVRWIDDHVPILDSPVDGVDGTIELYIQSLEPVQTLFPSGQWEVERPTITSFTDITTVDPSNRSATP